MTQPLRVHSCNCFAARQAARDISKLYDHHLSTAGITVTQFSILVFLDEAPGMTMNELAKAMVMDRTTLIRNLKPLQREGFLQSAPSEANGRQLALSLTRDGERKLKEAMPLWELAQAAFESQVGAKHAARLRRDLLDITQ
jgi:DNA-binding MarR family transcriptional regulator